MASYFWKRLNDYYKGLWKLSAQEYNDENALLGKKKRRGFWHFAINLQQQMRGFDNALFKEMWQYLVPEERIVWWNPADSLIHLEIARIKSNMNYADL